LWGYYGSWGDGAIVAENPEFTIVSTLRVGAIMRKPVIRSDGAEFDSIAACADVHGISDRHMRRIIASGGDYRGWTFEVEQRSKPPESS